MAKIDRLKRRRRQFNRVGELAAKARDYARENKLPKVGKRLDGAVDYSAKRERELTNAIERLQRPEGVPAWLAREHFERWLKPWSEDARGSSAFKSQLLAHGYLSPHFTKREASGRHRNPLGTDVPANLLGNAQRHAFNLEILRHELGDIVMTFLSWYRNPQHNADVGGASQSRHMQADATDFDQPTIARAGGTGRFDQVADRVFANGGFGQYPSGARHVDSRGWRARWSSFKQMMVAEGAAGAGGEARPA